MTIITLSNEASTDLEIDLGDSSSGVFANGDLGYTSGNLYIQADGVEYGSLFFHRGENGKLNISLGQYDHRTEEWETAGTLTLSVPETEVLADAAEAESETPA